MRFLKVEELLQKVTQKTEDEIDYYRAMWFKNGDAK